MSSQEGNGPDMVEPLPASWQATEAFHRQLLRGEAPDPARVAAGDAELFEDLLLVHTLHTLGQDAICPFPVDDQCSPAHPLGGRYVLLRRLGAGGMGVVYLAEDVELERKVAVKLFRDDRKPDAQRDLKRVLGEPKLQARLDHENVVQVYDIGKDEDDTYFMVMELVEGGSALGFVEGRLPRDWRWVTEVVRDACRGVERVHTAGLLHRDVKPGNILLKRDGTAKLGDFGLAKACPLDAPSPSVTGEVQGTLFYMSPEQRRGRPGPGSDLYSLGLTYQAMLAGTHPVPGTACDLRGIPAGCARVIRRATHPEPDRRYRSATEMLADLERLLRPRTRHRLALGALSVVLLGVALSTGWSLQAPPGRRGHALPATPARPPVFREVHGIPFPDLAPWLEQVAADGYRPLHIDLQYGCDAARGSAVAVRDFRAPPFRTIGPINRAPGPFREGERRFGHWRFLHRGKDLTFYAIVRDGRRTRIYFAKYRTMRGIIERNRAIGLYPGFLGFNDPRVSSYLRAVLLSSEGREWKIDYHLSPGELLTKLSEYRHAGFRPTLIEAYLRDEQPFYILVGIANHENGDWAVQVGLTPDDYERCLGEYRAAGFYPACVTAYGPLNNTRYTAIWRAPAARSP